MFSKHQTNGYLDYLEAATVPRIDEIKAAIWRGQLSMHYQPLYDLSSGLLVAFESLIRWHHPIRGNVSPADFIAVAEETDVIHDLGSWVMKSVCADRAKLPARSVAVNASATQLKHPDFADHFIEIMHHFGVDPKSIGIEVTETIKLDYGVAERQNLQTLSDAGCLIVVDDFGAGFADISYLRRFPFSVLKIDKSYTSRINYDAQSRDFIRDICAVAKELGVIVVAEGMECESQLRTVAALGVNGVQGYLLGRPQPLSYWVPDGPAEPIKAPPAIGRNLNGDGSPPELRKRTLHHHRMPARAKHHSARGIA